MKHVLLLGDSIRMGYEKAVRASLEGFAGVYAPSQNGAFACNVLRYLNEHQQLIGGEHFDVIHWNAGLWDCMRLFGEEPSTPPEIYRYYIERICIRMAKLYPGAKYVFATTTSVKEEWMDPDFFRCNADVEAYNAAALEIVERYGHAVDDLYAVSKTLPDHARTDTVHFNTPGATEAFTRQILSCLMPVLGLDRVPDYREDLYIGAPDGR